MKTLRTALSFLLVATLLCACVPEDKKNVYQENDIGKNTIVSFGTVLSLREVKIEGNNSGAGMLAGGTAGGFAGSAIGSGRGNTTAIIAGAIIGAVAGAVAEQELKEQKGIEYIIRFETLDLTKSIVQTLPKGEVPVAIGACVMVQQSGNYQRVLPATDPKLCAVEDDSTTKRHKSTGTKKKQKVTKVREEE